MNSPNVFSKMKSIVLGAIMAETATKTLTNRKKYNIPTKPTVEILKHRKDRKKKQRQIRKQRRSN